MTLKEIQSKYILSDGKVIFCLMSFDEEPFVTITLKVREKADGKVTDVKLELKFSEIIECCIFEDFKTQYYSDITLLQLENQDYYLSLDPFGNSNTPNENDNFIIKSKKIDIYKKD